MAAILGANENISNRNLLTVLFGSRGDRLLEASNRKPPPDQQACSDAVGGWPRIRPPDSLRAHNRALNANLLPKIQKGFQ